ncbi:MAG: hypothetical protein JNK79_11205 [Chitinophagaceae bacterium]|nr:hypothetical protein [Chitinophagaceae bacterium]
MKFKDKVIFIISYENWGAMRMSKHHYAIELGKAGNKVYFINHPDKRYELRRGEVRVLETDAINVFEVKHRLFYPYFLKFKANWLYNLTISWHIRKIIKAVGFYPEIVWSFDTGNTIPLRYFPKSELRILMPVDGPFGHKHEMRAVKGADVIISVTERILSVFKKFPIPGLLVNHGVAQVFLDDHVNGVANDKIRIGYSGSLVRNDLDTKCFLHLVKSHPDKIFEFWGENDFRKSNMHLPQDVSRETLKFLETLKSMPNVVMHGPVSSETLALGLKKMDCLFLCYSIKNDQNHHKVLEYLGTGKAIVSNHLSSYKDAASDLLVMAQSTDNNDAFPKLFDAVVKDLGFYNSKDKQEVRKKYARQFSYAENIRRIETFVNDHVKTAQSGR